MHTILHIQGSIPEQIYRLVPRRKEIRRSPEATLACLLKLFKMSSPYNPNRKVNRTAERQDPIMQYLSPGSKISENTRAMPLNMMRIKKFNFRVPGSSTSFCQRIREQAKKMPRTMPSSASKGLPITLIRMINKPDPIMHPIHRKMNLLPNTISQQLYSCMQMPICSSRMIPSQHRMKPVANRYHCPFSTTRQGQLIMEETNHGDTFSKKKKIVLIKRRRVTQDRNLQLGKTVFRSISQRHSSSDSNSNNQAGSYQSTCHTLTYINKRMKFHNRTSFSHHSQQLFFFLFKLFIWTQSLNNAGLACLIFAEEETQ